MSKDLSVRYGASLNLRVTLDDAAATSATIYIGNEGEAYLVEKTGAFVDGVADISLDTTDTELPLGTYKYQINVDYDDGKVIKFPAGDSCDGDTELPNIQILEALDLTEAS